MMLQPVYCNQKRLIPEVSPNHESVVFHHDDEMLANARNFEKVQAVASNCSDSDVPLFVPDIRRWTEESNLNIEIFILKIPGFFVVLTLLKK